MKLRGKVAIVTGGARDLGRSNICKISRRRQLKFV